MIARALPVVIALGLVAGGVAALAVMIPHIKLAIVAFNHALGGGY
ncbi:MULTISPECIES: hypothetical protein [unclassified Bradyrhizobium]|nr:MULTISPECIES: hypothetical protein [unclassified Bradyrhizobium]